MMKQQVKTWDITPRPPRQVEMRLVVWETKEIPNMDIEGTTDLYIQSKMTVGGKDSGWKETDTHYRCQTGEGSFNY